MPLPIAASAQTAPDDGLIHEIIVTAQKREQALNTVPMSITAITGDQLKVRGITDVESLTKVTPGLSYAESGNGVPVYSLRGVGFFDTTLGALPTVSVYQDEVPLVFSIMSQGASFDLERVEVLKGPQGTLFGQNATGGAINYVAARPTRKLSGGFDVSFGRFNSFDATAFVSGPLSPEASIRIAGRTQLSDDWQYSYTRDDSLGAKRFYQGRLALDVEPSDRLKLALNLTGFIDNSDTQAGQKINVPQPLATIQALVPLTAAYPNAPRNSRAADWDAGRDLRRNNDFYQASLRGDLDLSDTLSLISITAWSRMKVDQLMDQDGMNLLASLTNIRGKLRSFSQELRLAGDFGPAHVVLGANYANDRSDEDDAFTFPYTSSSRGLSLQLGLPVPDASGLVGSQRIRTKAVFGNLDLDIGSRFIAHAGVRYTDSRDEYASCAIANSAATAAVFSRFLSAVRARAGLSPITIPLGGCYTLNDQLQPLGGAGVLHEDNISWRAGLDWKPVDGTLIYANVSRGYKAGSAPILPAIQSSQTRPVVQESLLAYELGFKTSLIRHVLEASGALFYYDYTDKQVLGRINTVLGPFPGLTNIPKSRIQGAEFQITTYPAKGMMLSVGGVYLDTEVTAPFTTVSILGGVADFEGDPFPYTPKYQLVADWQYVRPVTDRLDLLLGANLNYRSSTIAGFGVRDAFTAANIGIDAYTLVDARAGVQSNDESWQATLFVRNLTNQYYWTNVARLSDVIRRYAGMPRTWGVQFSRKF